MLGVRWSKVERGER